MRLRETSALALPGIAWTSPAWMLGDAKLALDARWRVSVHHRLKADYDGVFDPSALRGGRRDEFTLGASASMPGGWSLRLEWRRTRQGESELAPIYRAGVAAGTVRQPRLAIDDWGLALSRPF